MTKFSIQCLLDFFNRFPTEIREPVADYGGVGPIVKDILAKGGVNDYTRIDYKSGYDLLKPIKGRKYRTGICMDLLEHVSNPFIVAKNISDSLEKDSLLFVTVPFVWALHNHPKDYFRFTVDGLKAVFPKMKYIECGLATDVTKPVKDIKGHPTRKVDWQWHTRVIGWFRK